LAFAVRRTRDGIHHEFDDPGTSAAGRAHCSLGPESARRTTRSCGAILDAPGNLGGSNPKKSGRAPVVSGTVAG
jgi:hypothetical protein